MSLESKIEALTQAVVALTAKLESSNVAPTPAVAQAPEVKVHAPEPTVIPKTEAPVMPTPPVFVAPEPAPAPAGAPFSDAKGLIDYVMGAYKALGPQKGAQIQTVLTGLGYQNINDVKPEHYADLFKGVEALKG